MADPPLGVRHRYATQRIKGLHNVSTGGSQHLEDGIGIAADVYVHENVFVLEMTAELLVGRQAELFEMPRSDETSAGGGIAYVERIDPRRKRPGNFASFVYLLHLEYPEPGMYSFDSLLDGPLHRWLLWEKEWMVKQLYACRQEGLITKVSEIDAMRQFTTKYSLAEAVDHIVPLVKGDES